MRKQRAVRRIYGMKYSWKGHKDRKKTEWASSVGLCLRHKPQHPHHVKESLRGRKEKEALKKTENWQYGLAVLHLTLFPAVSTLCNCFEIISTWWWCYGLCLWHKPAELTHSFLFCSCVYFCLYGPFSCISFHKFSRQLSAFSICSSGLIFASLVLSTIILFLKVSFSPDIILCGWLGLKHQQT